MLCILHCLWGSEYTSFYIKVPSGHFKVSLLHLKQIRNVFAVRATSMSLGLIMERKETAVWSGYVSCIICEEEMLCCYYSCFFR